MREGTNQEEELHQSSRTLIVTLLKQVLVELLILVDLLCRWRLAWICRASCSPLLFWNQGKQDTLCLFTFIAFSCSHTRHLHAHTQIHPGEAERFSDTRKLVGWSPNYGYSFAQIHRYYVLCVHTASYNKLFHHFFHICSLLVHSSHSHSHSRTLCSHAQVCFGGTWVGSTLNLKEWRSPTTRYWERYSDACSLTLLATQQRRCLSVSRYKESEKERWWNEGEQTKYFVGMQLRSLSFLSSPVSFFSSPLLLFLS